MADAEAATPPDVIFQMPINNKAKDIMKIAEDVLGAKIAMAKKDTNGAITLLREAVVNSGHAEIWRTARLVLSCARIAGRGLASER